jgi:hypothetical protein
MRNPVAAALIVGALALTPLAALAASPSGQSGHPAKAQKASHATGGVVQTIDATSLVITRAGIAGEMTFTLNPETRREGPIEKGTPVSVRYRDDGNTHIATAVMAQHTATTATTKPGR